MAKRLGVTEAFRGLVVGLDGGQLITELFAAVKLTYLGQVNFSEPLLNFRILLIGDHAVSQFAFG